VLLFGSIIAAIQQSGESALFALQSVTNSLPDWVSVQRRHGIRAHGALHLRHLLPALPLQAAPLGKAPLHPIPALGPSNPDQSLFDPIQINFKPYNLCPSFFCVCSTLFSLYLVYASRLVCLSFRWCH